MKANPPSIVWVHASNVYFSWSWAACGVGQLSISRDAETGDIEIMDEGMGKERVRALLYALADHLVDVGKLTD